MLELKFHHSKIHHHLDYLIETRCHLVWLLFLVVELEEVQVQQAIKDKLLLNSNNNMVLQITKLKTKNKTITTNSNNKELQVLNCKTNNKSQHHNNNHKIELINWPKKRNNKKSRGHIRKE